MWLTIPKILKSPFHPSIFLYAGLKRKRLDTPVLGMTILQRLEVGGTIKLFYCQNLLKCPLSKVESYLLFDTSSDRLEEQGNSALTDS